jgi:hypothetical protein
MIKKDVSRTYPSLLNTPELRLSLERILCAYAAFDTEVGYCQGMNFIAATMLLTQKDELMSFYTFLHVMRDKNWRELYKHGTPGLLTLLEQTDQLVARLLPGLHSHLSKSNLEGCFAQFFLTVYLSSLPWDAALRVLDMFLLEGGQFLVNLLVKMLQLNQTELLQMEEEELYACLKSSFANDSFQRYLPSTLMSPPDEGDEEDLIIFD